MNGEILLRIFDVMCCFASIHPRALVKVNGIMIFSKYQDNLDKNEVRSPRKLKLGHKINQEMVNCPQNVFFAMAISDLNPLENVWYELN